MTSGNGVNTGGTVGGTTAATRQSAAGGTVGAVAPTPDDFKAALELHHYNLKQGQVERDKRLKVRCLSSDLFEYQQSYIQY